MSHAKSGFLPLAVLMFIYTNVMVAGRRFYNEKLVRSSDMDVNTRLRRAGGRILLAPNIVRATTRARTIREFVSRNLLDGFWTLYPLRFGSRLARLRHLTPLLCLLGFLAASGAAFVNPHLWAVLVGLLFVDVLALFSLGFFVAARRRDATLIVLLPLVFMIRHSAFALGSLLGALRALVSRDFWSGMTPLSTQPPSLASR